MKPSARRLALALAALLASSCGGAQRPAPAPVRPAVTQLRTLETADSPQPAADPATAAGPSPPPPAQQSAGNEGLNRYGGLSGAGAATNAVSLEQLESRIEQDRSVSMLNPSTSCAEAERAAHSICEASRALCELDHEQRCARATAACNDSTQQCHARCSRCGG